MRTPLLLVLAFAGCVDAGEPHDDASEAAAEADSFPTTVDGKADGWDVASTFHVGTHRFDTATRGGRRVFPVWGMKGVELELRTDATEGYDVRIAVLGPLVNGARQVLGADGYTARKTSAGVRVTLAQSGEQQIVVGSYRLANETFFDVSARCLARCGGTNVDLLASPKAGALVGEGGLVSTRLGAALANRSFDVELELWASPPAQPWAARHVATSQASGDQANIIVPAGIAAGDDLQLVVREAGAGGGSHVLDSGVPVRFAPQPSALVRLDSILYGDIASVEVSGVAPFFEGRSTIALRSVPRNVEIATHTIVVDQPGQVGNGMNAFDATFAPELEDGNGTINPNLPRNGELLSVGVIGGGDGVFRALGCFEYCNDLSGMDSCTGGARACR